MGGVRGTCHRLTEADRSQSEVSPATREGPFRVLYVLGDEALSELRNATVHAFLALALNPAPRGLHALLGDLREASESFHPSLHGPDRPLPSSHCLSSPRSPSTARVAARVRDGAADSFSPHSVTRRRGGPAARRGACPRRQLPQARTFYREQHRPFPREAWSTPHPAHR
jgi:hypothetical protein